MELTREDTKHYSNILYCTLPAKDEQSILDKISHKPGAIFEYRWRAIGHNIHGTRRIYVLDPNAKGKFLSLLDHWNNDKWRYKSL